MINYTEILKKELIPALGCTEPIAIAYATSKARDVLGDFPEKIIAKCSGNIIKNVKGVIVPSTKDMKGIEASAILGLVAGVTDKKLEVLTEVRDHHLEKVRELVKSKMCSVELAEGVENLYIEITLLKGDQSSNVIIRDSHTNIVSVSKNNEQIFKGYEASHVCKGPNHTTSLRGIYDYIETVDTKDLELILDDQIHLNKNIALEGIKENFGANVGKTLINSFGSKVENLAKAYAASASDARMGGCSLPVIINSGSGNQGITVSLPVIAYAEDLKVSEEKLYRALALSNLIAIHIKKCIGKLSAYCGVVSAAAGSGAAIAYLNGADYDVISKTIINALGNTSGIICDGAKASCAAKIASSVDSAIMGYNMAKRGDVFGAEEGIVNGCVEQTIKNICRVARDGMKSTDIEILNIMIGK